MLWLPPPEGLSIAGWQVAALTVLIGCWWFTEAVPVTLTGSLPFLLLPLLGVAKPEVVASQYMSPVLFLILGGTLIGAAFERWNLHRRVALFVVARANPEPRAMLFNVMAVTALLSMWVNNSATTVMMLPIATATLAAMVPNLDSSDVGKDRRNFAAAMVLGIALASNIGGFATPIGTPVNSIAVGILDRSFDVQISFVEWMAFGIPFALLLLPICWWVLAFVTSPFRFEGSSRESVRAAIGVMGQMGTAEWRVIAVVTLVALAWVFQPWLTRWVPGISDAGIAIAGALLLALLPSGEQGSTQRNLLEWEDAKRAPWYLILLLGGGLALADAVVKSGLSAWLGETLAIVSGLPLLPMLLAIAVMCALITEAASNVATATIFMPIAASLALGANYDPVLAALAAAMAANLGFANPAATSSNALVYSTGRIPIAMMLKSGLWIDIFGAIAIAVLCFLIVPLLPL